MKRTRSTPANVNARPIRTLWIRDHDGMTHMISGTPVGEMSVLAPDGKIYAVALEDGHA